MSVSSKPLFLTLAGSLMLGALGIAQTAVAGPQGDYTVSPDGQPVVSGSGGCVHSGSWKKSMPTCPEPTLVIEDGKAMIVFAAADSEFFGFDKVKLSDEIKKDLDTMVSAVDSADLIHAINITGHADRIGPAPYNGALAMRRAEAVKDYLVSKGIPADRIVTRSDGSSGPLVTCPGIKNEHKLIRCLAPNRRVDIEAVLADTVDVANITLVPSGN